MTTSQLDLVEIRGTLDERTKDGICKVTAILPFWTHAVDQFYESMILWSMDATASYGP
jgi:hypothetical protein